MHVREMQCSGGFRIFGHNNDLTSYSSSRITGVSGQEPHGYGKKGKHHRSVLLFLYVWGRYSDWCTIEGDGVAIFYSILMLG